LTSDWVLRAQTLRYSYNFDWLGVPIIQYPQDLVALQEIVWRVRPNVIVETGVARGGSVIFYASLLELIAACGGDEGRVIGVDIDIRDHNRRAISAHPLSKRIALIEGSSTEPEVVGRVQEKIADGSRVLVCLDSNHTHDHVLAELRAYAPMVSVGSYAVVFDTVIEDLPSEAIGVRPWGRGNNPRTAVRAFLRDCGDFVIDDAIADKLQITVARGGYLRRDRQ
jgi:cephalosporin hydroxylase